MAEGSRMIPMQLNTLCAAYGNVDGMSLHTASGVDASDMLGSKESLTWNTPTAGVMSAAATFEDVTGAVCFVRVWDGTTFIEEFSVNGGDGIDAVAQDVTVGIQHRVKSS